MPETFFFFLFCVDVFLISCSISHDPLYIGDQELKLQGKGRSYDTNHLGIELIYQTFLFHWAEKNLSQMQSKSSMSLHVRLITNKCDFSQTYIGTVIMTCAIIGFSCVYFQLISSFYNSKLGGDEQKKKQQKEETRNRIGQKGWYTLSNFLFWLLEER